MGEKEDMVICSLQVLPEIVSIKKSGIEGENATPYDCKMKMKANDELEFLTGEIHEKNSILDVHICIVCIGLDCISYHWVESRIQNLESTPRE